MLIIVTFYLLSCLLSSLAIGALCFLVSGESLVRMNYKKGILVVFFVVGIADLLMLPPLLELDLSIKVGNPEVLSLFGIQQYYFRVNDLISVGWFEIITWIVQATVAYFAGHSLYDNAIRRIAATTRSEPTSAAQASGK
jgi:hypothetical protein